MSKNREMLSLRIVSTAAMVAALTAFAGVAHAAPEPADAAQSSNDNEIVVTARKRGDESLNDIGGSIQAITGDDLAKKSSLGFADYARLVPGLASNSSGPGQTQIQLRGVNTTRLNRFNANVPSTVGMFFGETALTTSGYEADAGLIDIARVEVLRGPQGTLYGASSMAGAIRVIPNDPSLSGFAVNAGGSASLTEKGSPSSAFDLTVNVPLGDRLAVRAIGYNISTGGFIDNVYPLATKKDINSDNSWGGRLMTKFEASDRLTLRGTLSYQKTHSDGRPIEYVPFDPAAGIALESGVSFLLPGEQLSDFQVTKEFQTAKELEESFDDEFWFATFQADAKLADWIDLTSVTSYSDRKILDVLDDTPRFRDFIIGVGGQCGTVPGPCVGIDNDVPVTAVPNINATRMKRFSQDLRFNIKPTENVSAIFGLYYEDEARIFNSDLYIRGIDSWTLGPIGSVGGFVPPSVVPETDGVDNAFDGLFDIKTKQFAVYGEASVRLGNLEANIGGRYFTYTQKALLDWVGWAEFGRDTLNEKISEDGFNPKAELVYHATDDLLVYASAAKGFRLGSVAQVVNLNFCQSEIDALGIKRSPFVKSDSLWSYEGGVKATLFGGSTNVRASAYHIDWKNARNSVNLTCGWIVELSDLQVESNGVEVEISSRLTDALAISLAAGYNDSALSKDATSITAFKGDRTPYVPKWTAAAGFDYVEREAIGKWDVFLRGDVSYVGNQLTELGTGVLARHVIPSSTTLNLYTGVSSDDLTFTLFMKNAADEDVFVGASLDRRQPLNFTRGRPRSFGASVRVNF